MQIQSQVQKKEVIEIGYYNLRGKAQVCRLLCEYLHIPYIDRKFSYIESLIYKRNQLCNESFCQLPFLRQGRFFVTESVPMCVYLIMGYSNYDQNPPLLGIDSRDKSIVLTYLWTIQNMATVITLNSQPLHPLQLQALKLQQWNVNIAPKIKLYEDAASPRDWFLGYLTIIDFSLYELVRYMDCLFNNRMSQFPKLKRIEKMLGALPAISAYQKSERAVVQWDPSVLLKQIKALDMTKKK